MLRYIGGRLFQAVLSILIVATVVFFLVRLTGDPARFFVPDSAPIEMQERIRGLLGLDRPLYEQYLSYLFDLVRLNLGTSFSGQPVLEILFDHLPATLALTVAAFILAVVVGVPLGLLSAVKRGTIIDRLANIVSLLGQSVPTFWLAIILILIFSVNLHLLPVAGRSSLASYVLPAITLGWAAVAGITRLTRSSMLEVLDADYVRMARAKGLPVRVVVGKHALRTAIIPVVTFAGLMLAAFMNGSVVIESIFAWPGIGRVILDAVTGRDFPVIQGAVILIAAIYVVINLLVDILYVVIDPRIRYRR
jgi:peptide/nickel transport system permease protein